MQTESHIILSSEQFNLLMGEIRDLRFVVTELQRELKPAIKFFNEPVDENTTTKKRVSRKEKQRLDEIKQQQEVENHQKMLELKILNEIKKGA